MTWSWRNVLLKSYAVLVHDDYVGILFLLFFSPVGSDDNMEERPSFNQMSGQPQGMKRKLEIDDGQGGRSISTATSASGDDSSNGSGDDVNPSKFIKASTQAQMQPNPVVGKMMVST